jgi:hypothetical protein
LLFTLLGVFGLVFLARWIRQVRATGQGSAAAVRPSLWESAVGFVTNFFDTLGIGSFAPTTSIYKLKKMVPDERIPGTMHVGHTPPVIIQAFIFIAIIQIDLVTLVSMISAAVLGAWLGAGVVARLPRRQIQIGMGIALLVAAASFVMSIYGFFPTGGTALGMRGVGLVVAVGVSFALGALMTIGVGFYAPCMITISLLGMNPITAFPVMMGSSAFLMPVASIRFLKANKYSLRAAVGLALGGNHCR